MAEFWQQIADFFTKWGTQWPLIILGAVIFLLFAVFSKKLTVLVEKLIHKLFSRWPRTGEELSRGLKDPLRVFFIVLGIELAFLIISPETKWMTFVDKLFRMANISLIAWVLLNYTPMITRQFIRINDENDKIASEVAIRYMAIIIRIVIVSLLVVILISELGYNINGIIAGLGLSGLTVSLAAQNTVSNLFSGFEIISDRPFDVGDYISTKSAEGFVEDITMRSTRIRTREDLMVTVPNSVLMKEAITNYSRMELGKAVQFTISLTYETTSEQIQKVCGDLRAFLENDEDIDSSILSVAFKEFGDSGQNIEIMYFTKTTDKYENLRVRERINYEIRRIVEDAGAAFAFPTTTVHVEQ